MRKTWFDLTEEQKLEFKKYCDKQYGPGFMFSEKGEPLYVDGEQFLIDNEIIIRILFE